MARMLGKSSERPFVYGAGTGDTKKCFGCLDGCGYAADNKTQRKRERNALRNWVNEYDDAPEDEFYACPKGGLACICNKMNCLDDRLYNDCRSCGKDIGWEDGSTVCDDCLAAALGLEPK